ncbi:TssN family type VI secretion system protein [uncultured Draconibacterium sp.]|uniref:TssN family type VI secretion system protein n=1 Tax=uncultured Draconibacterium sp. TaxID=1573823 RepID=UPI00321651F9
MGNSFLIIVFLIVALILLGFVLKNKEVKAKLLISLIYVIVTGAIISIGALLGYRNFIQISYHLVYILLGSWMLVMGILHVFLIKILLPWADEENYGSELLFTVLVAAVGAVFMLLLFRFINFLFYPGINLTTLLLFILPYVFYGVLRRYLSIPVKILRKWYYPVDKHVEDPSDREMEMPLVVGFEFKKKKEDKNMTAFRAKAPKEMAFGKLFYYFINDYNHRNPDEKIEYLDENEKSIGWIFYFKPKMFSKIRYIDPEETNSFNLIKENTIIVCKRVIEK